MRFFFLLFVVSWLAGLAAGVSSVSLPLAVLLALLCVLLTRLGQTHLAVSVAAFALVMIGYFYATPTETASLMACKSLSEKPLPTARHEASAANTESVGDVPVGTPSPDSAFSHEPRAFRFDKASRTGSRSTGPLTTWIVEWPRVAAQKVSYVLEADGCRLLVTAGRWPTYQLGDKVQLTGAVSATSELYADNPGYAAYLARRQIAGTVRYPTLALVTREESAWQSARGSIRERIDRIFPEPTASLVAAMLLAEQDTIPPTIVEKFRRSGVSHILAISGFNISLLIAPFIFLCLFLPLSPLQRTLIVVAILWLYIAFISAPISAVRAAWFWTLTLSALRARLLISLSTVVILTAVTLLSLDPLVSLDVGFQLSLAAVVGIGAALFLRRRRAASASWRYLSTALLTTLGATLTTWPIVAYHFGNASPVGLAANLIVVPAASFMMMAAIITLGTSYLFMPLALVSSFAVQLAWAVMEVAVELAQSFPGAYMADLAIAPWFLWLYYLSLAGICVAVMAYQQRSLRQVWE